MGLLLDAVGQIHKWTATKAAVSVRRRLLPNDTGINPAAIVGFYILAY